MVNLEYSEAIVEVLGILQYLEEEEKSKIPNEIFEYFEKNKSKTYNPNIKYEEDINNLKIKEKTRQILAGLYLDYLCPEEEKKEYVERLRKKENIYQEKLKEKYNGIELFKNKKEENLKQDIVMLVPKKEESFFIKILNKIKNIFIKR